VASGLHDLVQVTRQEGFVIVATIPDGVKLAQLGACDDLVLMNSLGVTNRKVSIGVGWWQHWCGLVAALFTYFVHPFLPL